jgi:propionyl-CoA carboxylase alpha chain
MVESSGEVQAPMPGLIVEVTAAIGGEVAKGQTVIILESMKMQNELKSPMRGIVSSIHCTTGETVEKGALLIVIAATPEGS